MAESAGLVLAVASSSSLRLIDGALERLGVLEDARRLAAELTES